MAEYVINKYRTLFVRAKELYNDEKYKESATLLEIIVKNDETCYEGMYYLGSIYYYGLNGKADYDRAFELLILAAMNKQYKSAYLAGLCCLNGYGCQKNPFEAKSWFELAAKNSHIEAQYYLGLAYYNGEGANKSLHTALKCFLAAAKNKHILAKYMCGKCYEKMGKYMDAATMYLAAAIDGHVDGAEKIADYYLEGKYINKRVDLAIHFYEIGYQHKNYNCAYKLGLIYKSGEHVEADLKKAFHYFENLHPVRIDMITATDLQQCMDECDKGKRTHEMMKTTANLLWKYAMDSGYITANAASNLYTGKGKSVQREPITDDELKLIRNAIGKEPYADYVFCLCYLGFRPSEFLSLKKSDYHIDGRIHFLIGGSKTDAGRDRRVVIPAQIRSILDERMSVIGTDLLFPMVCHDRKGNFIGYKQMTHNYFNNFVFRPLMAHLGITGRVPYSARHTYADKLKRASGDAKDKAALIGHSDYDFTQHKYQSAPLEDLKKVVDSIK